MKLWINVSTGAIVVLQVYVLEQFDPGLEYEPGKRLIWVDMSRFCALGSTIIAVFNRKILFTKLIYIIFRNKKIKSVIFNCFWCSYVLKEHWVTYWWACSELTVYFIWEEEHLQFCWRRWLLGVKLNLFSYFNFSKKILFLRRCGLTLMLTDFIIWLLSLIDWQINNWFMRFLASPCAPYKKAVVCIPNPLSPILKPYIPFNSFLCFLYAEKNQYLKFPLKPCS